MSEESYLQDLKSYRDLKAELEGQENPATDPSTLIKPKGHYLWTTRPEYQFSVVDLQVQAINQSYIDELGEEQTTNLINTQVPVISDGATLLGILYGLSVGSTVDPLSLFDSAANDWTWVFGEEEQGANLGEGQTAEFGSLEHLSSLSSDELLTIRLISNSDPGNVLWEWALSSLNLVVDSKNENGFTEPVDNKKIAGIENIRGEREYPGKVITVDYDDTDKDGIPNYADSDAGNLFVPVKFKISGVGPDDFVQFSYSDSDPLIVVAIENELEENLYSLAPGYLRLWKKNGDEDRNALSINYDGDFIPADTLVLASKLGITDNTTEILLYVQSVALSSIVADISLSVEKI